MGLGKTGMVSPYPRLPYRPLLGGAYTFDGGNGSRTGSGLS